MSDDLMWKQRFQQLMLARLCGLALVLLGLAVMFSDLVRTGGWPQAGAFMVVVGALISLLAPKMLKRLWKRP